MRIYVQWTLKNPGDWVGYDFDPSNPGLWNRLPRLAAPKSGQTGDNNSRLGWIYAVNLQGVVFAGYDHYYAEEYVSPEGESGVRTVTWNDDPEDYPVGWREAQVRTFLPLAPDPNLGGAINTRQTLVWYAESERAAQLAAGGIQTRPYSEFVPPANPIHGIWVSDALAAKHDSLESLHGWEEWAEEAGYSQALVTDQRAQGRFLPNTHTMTWYQGNTWAGINAVYAQGEYTLEDTPPGSTSGGYGIPAGSYTYGQAFVTDAGVPNRSTWPYGTGNNYRMQCNITLTGANSGWNSLNLLRVDQSTNQLSWFGGSTGLSMGVTGIFLVSKEATDAQANPSGAASTDRIVYMTQLQNLNVMKSETVTFSWGTSDSFCDGPWSSGTQYPLSASGSLAPGGTVAFPLRGRTFTGGVTPGGTLGRVSSFYRSYQGAISSLTGTIGRKTSTGRFAGGVTPGGLLQNSLLKLLSVGGSIAPAGAIIRQTRKLFAGAAGSNILSNPGFETLEGGDYDPFATWVGYHDASADILDETVNVHSGSHALRLQGLDGSAFGYLYDLPSVTPNTTYTLSFWTRGDGTTDLEYEVADYTHFEPIISKTATGITGTTYQQYSVDFTTPAGCNLISLYLWIYAKQGDVYVDDVSIRAKGTQAIGPSGVLSRATATSRFLGNIAPSGVFSRLGTFYRTYAGSLTPGGALSNLKAIVRTFGGSIAPSGALAKGILRPFAGSLTPGGALVRRTWRTLSGAITPGGALIRRTGRALAGVVQPAGALARSTRRTLAGALQPSGAFSRVASFYRSFAGGVTPSAILENIRIPGGGAIYYLVADGLIAPSGVLLKRTVKALAGAIPLTGVLTRKTSRLFVDALTPVGDLLTASVFGRAFAGAITPVGDFAKTTLRAFAGAIGSSSTLTRVTHPVFQGTIAPLGLLQMVPTWIYHAPVLRRLWTAISQSRGVGGTGQVRGLGSGKQSSGQGGTGQSSGQGGTK